MGWGAPDGDELAQTSQEVSEHWGDTAGMECCSETTTMFLQKLQKDVSQDTLILQYHLCWEVWLPLMQQVSTQSPGVPVPFISSEVTVALARAGFSFPRHIKEITVCTMIKCFVNSHWSARKVQFPWFGQGNIPVGWDLQKP